VPFTDRSGLPRTGNRLLDDLPGPLFDLLNDKLTSVALVSGAALIEPFEPVENVYFPVDGIISIVRRLEDGASVEVAVVGHDGLVGVSILLDDDREPTESMVQSAGSALCIKADILRELLTSSPALRTALLRFVQALLAEMAQSAACNARHTAIQRLARWLLTSSDRTDRAELGLSHEFIAMMLGIRRAGVSVAFGQLREAGLVTNGRNKINIIDRPGLEAIACECYRDTKVERARLFPPQA